MFRHFAPRKAAAIVTIGAVAVALSLVGASAAQASNSSSASKLEKAIQSLRADNSIDAFHHNTLVDAWLEKGLKKYADHPTAASFSTDLGAAPQGPAGYSPFVIKVSHATVAKALAALETYDTSGLEDVSASFGPAGWVTKGSSAYIGFSTVTYAQLPWQSFGHVSLTSTPVNGTAMVPKMSGWSPTPSSYDYAWSVDGGVTTLSTSSQFTPNTSDIGHRVTVTVTPVLAGYQTPGAKSATSDHKTIEGTIHAPKSLVVNGTRTVGQALTVTGGVWKPVLVNPSYQWYRNDHAIAGADGIQYTLTSDDKGKRIDVKMTGSLPGFHSDSVRTHTSHKVSS